MKKIQATVMLFGVMFLITGTVKANDLQFTIESLVCHKQHSNQIKLEIVEEKETINTSETKKELFEVLSSEPKHYLPEQFEDIYTQAEISKWLSTVKNNLTKEQYQKFINLQKQSKHKDLSYVSELTNLD